MAQRAAALRGAECQRALARHKVDLRWAAHVSNATTNRRRKSGASKQSVHWPCKLLEDCVCTATNLLPRSLIAETSAVHGEWSVLAIAAQPKAGSSSLRVLVSALAPAYRNAQNKSGGEENDAVHCNTLKAETDAMAAAEVTRKMGGFRVMKTNGRVLSAMLLREPTARFLSGAAEVFARHCSGWLQFRRDERRYAKGVRRSSSAGYNLPPSVGPVVTHAGVQQRILARVKFKKNRECAVVGGAAGLNVLAWNESLALDELLRTLVADLAVGYRDKHVTQQTYAVLAQPHPGALISIDSQSEWSDFFLASAGLRHRNLTVQQLLSGGGMHTHSRVSSRIASATQGIELLLERAFDKRTWQLYCALYTVDYVCLGFELPRRCRTHYRVHEARVA